MGGGGAAAAGVGACVSPLIKSRWQPGQVRADAKAVPLASWAMAVRPMPALFSFLLSLRFQTQT